MTDLSTSAADIARADASADDRRATTAAPILPAIAARWSPRGFTDAPVTATQLLPCFEAARWAASAFNLQPWSFICGLKGDAVHERILGTLGAFNATWASVPGALMLSIAHTVKPDGSPNTHALYDLGQAVALFATQASQEGLYVHQMAGFDAGAAAEVFGLPEGQKAITAIAIGALGSPASLPEKLAEREIAPRERKPLAALVTWA